MTKQSGLGSKFFAGAYDISGDVGALNAVEVARAPLDVSSIEDQATARLTALRDGTLAFTGFWNITAGQAHPVLSALPTTDQIMSLYLYPLTVGTPAASLTSKQTTYAQSRGQDGSLAISVTALGNGYGLEWGEQLTTGKQSFATGTVSGTAIDLGAASTAFGAAAYLQVFSVASGTATFTVQDSDDNLSFTAITGLAFTGATGATTQRLQTSTTATIRQYVRVQGTGVHGAAVVAVNFVRYTESVAV